MVNFVNLIGCRRPKRQTSGHVYEGVSNRGGRIHPRYGQHQSIVSSHRLSDEKRES